jgi:putative membrane protein
MGGPAPARVVAGWRGVPLAVLAAGAVALAVSLAVPAQALAHAAGELTAVPEPTPLDAIADWSFDPSIQVPALLAAALYLWAVLRVRREHPGNPVPLSRLVSFLAGLAVIEYALQGPVDHYESILFADHMSQHLLLMMVAAPLLVMGAPVTLLLRVASPRARTRWIMPLLHSRLVRLVSHPIVASVLFAGILWVTHFSSVYELSLENDTVHNAEHLAYLAASLLFWWPMVGRDPSPWNVSHPLRLVVMLLQMTQGAFLGIAIMNAGAPLYAHYADLQLTWITPLADQQLAGAIMWGAGGLGFLAAGLVIFFDWMRVEEQAALRVDARLDREEHARQLARGLEATAAGDEDAVMRAPDASPMASDRPGDSPPAHGQGAVPGLPAEGR